MSANTVPPDRAEYLRQKYVTAPQPGPAAQAEQLARTVSDVHKACEQHNRDEGMGWLNWRVPERLRERIDLYLVRLREALARQSRGGGRFVDYYDDRNKFDVENGWVPYNPDNPDHQNVPFGHIVSDYSKTKTVHVLRSGTEPLFNKRENTSRKSVGEPPNEGLPDWGPSYNFTTFMAGANYNRIFRWCDMHLPDGCVKGIGGPDLRLAAVPLGRDIFVVSICEPCRDALAAELTQTGPE